MQGFTAAANVTNPELLFFREQCIKKLANFMVPHEVGSLLILLLWPARARAQDSVAVADSVVAAVCDKDVVLLGELPSHGEARAFYIKSRIVERLVERCRFNAVLFEAPVYDFVGLNRAIKTRSATAKQLDDAIGGFWSTRELTPFRAWLFERASRRSITIGGIDDQVSATSQYARSILPDLIASASHLSGEHECRAVVERNLKYTYDAAHPFDETEGLRLRECARSAARTLEDGVDRTDRMMLVNFANYTDRQRSAPGPSRDEEMYRNVLWYLQRLPKRAKVVIWTATVHAARRGRDSARLPLGARVSEQYGQRAAAVGFTAFGGSSSMAGRHPTVLADAPIESLESLATSAEREWSFLDAARLRQFGDAPSRLLGRFTSADWSNFFDVVVVIRNEIAPSSLQ